MESSLYTQLGYTTYTDVRGVVRGRSRVLLRCCSTEPGAAPLAAGCKASVQFVLTRAPNKRARAAVVTLLSKEGFPPANTGDQRSTCLVTILLSNVTTHPLTISRVFYSPPDWLETRDTLMQAIPHPKI